MRKLCTRVGVVCLLVVAFGTLSLSAQTTFNDQRDQRKLNEIVANLPLVVVEAGRLERYAWEALAVALTIGLLGLCSAAAGQLAKAPKVPVTAVGVVIGGLTLFNSTVLVFDYKTLNGLAREARDIVQALTGQSDQYRVLVGQNGTDPLSPDSRVVAEEHLQNVAHLQQDLTALEARANEGGYTLRVNKKLQKIRETRTVGAIENPKPLVWMPLFDGPVALAAQQKPDWLTAAPYDVNRIGVVGIGGCSTATGAREMARYNAIESVARDLVKANRGMDLDLVMNALERNAQQARDYFYRDANGMYWHSMLLYFQRAILDVGLIDPQDPKPDPVFHTQLSVPVPASGSTTVTIAAVSKKPEDGSFEFVATLSREDAGVRFALGGIAVHWDGSIGTTRWIFRIRANDRDLLTVPLHRYDDEGRPTRCFVREEERTAWRQATIGAATGTITLGIDALKP